MAKLPTATDVSNARRQATAALEQARTPLYAVLGAGELASEAVRDYVAKARAEAGGQTRDVQARVGDLPARLAELQARLGEVRNQVRTRVSARVGELPEEVTGLRGRLESVELRHALESYAQSLHELYERLAVRGEAAVARLREQPRVRQAMDRVEEAADTTEERVGKFVEDARVLVADVLGLAGRRTHPSDRPAGGARDRSGSGNGNGAQPVAEVPASSRAVAGGSAPAAAHAAPAAASVAAPAAPAAAASVAEGAAVAGGATASPGAADTGGVEAPRASGDNGASTRGVPAKSGRVQPSRGTAGRKPASPRKTGGSA